MLKGTTHGILSLKGLICVLKVGILGEVLGKHLNRIFNSFPDVCFNMLMHQKECIGEFGIILWLTSVFYFYLAFVYLCFFVFFSLSYLFLFCGLVGTKGIYWISVICLLGEGDLNCLQSSWGGQA